ncbi:restriction endonuclease [Methanobrevibacter filiformis]|uniref:Restriction endonuclease n=1 Tax=Methanobrevibacter filiformis TaxID=55758 RepID=A0A166EVH0_9EURY|nr:restriction endonuclease [Methanobrevibacter filiformis]KZX17059.1 restriction endonuclease [Methanobrevibacter filiformis]
MEKLQLVNFIATVMEESGFKVYKDFKTSQMVVDIYGVLPSVLGDFTVVVTCKNYDVQWKVGIDVLKEMEMVGRNLKASKIAIVTSSSFSTQSRSYASRKGIKLVDRENLLILAKKFSKKGASLATHQSMANNHHSNTIDHHNNLNNSVNKPNNFNNLNTSNNPNNSNSLNNSNNNNYSDDDNNLDPSQVQFPISGTDKNLNNVSGQVNENRVVNNYSNGPIKKASLKRRVPEKKKEPINIVPVIRSIFGNMVSLIILVVAISYILSIGLESLNLISGRPIGAFRIISAVLLSYGLNLVLNKKGVKILIEDISGFFVKGTIIFFVSLIFIVILIIFNTL